MELFLNPFGVHNRDRATNPADVVIPVDGARRNDDKHQMVEKTSDTEAVSLESSDTWTMESLKASLDQDAVASGHDEVYDRSYGLLQQSRSNSE